MAEKTFHSLTLPGQDTARVPLTAAEFSTSVAYKVKDYCTYQGKLYRCTVAHAAGAWNASHFVETDIDAELDRKLDIPPSQAGAPANPRVGDLWVDNDENSPIYNVDAAPVAGSTNAVQSGGTKTALNAIDSRKVEHGCITGDFSASVDYRVGDLVFYATTANGITTRTLYRCTTAHNATAWNAAHFTATTLEVELQRVRDNEANTDMIGELFGARSTYVVGDYCIYNGNLYKCIQAVDNTGVITPAFDPDDWIQVALANDVSDLKSALDEISTIEVISEGYGTILQNYELEEITIYNNILSDAYIRKCGKNLFNKNEFLTTTNYLPNPIKYYQPFLPIYVKPNTTYKVTFEVFDRDYYNTVTWNNKQWVSPSINNISGIDSSVLSNRDILTVNITSDGTGCLYFINVWNTQSKLDAFFRCIHVMIVENNVYDDYSTYEEYSGIDVRFSPNMVLNNYTTFIIHRDKTDSNLLDDLPSTNIIWGNYIANIKSDRNAIINEAVFLSNNGLKKNKIPLFVDTIADYNWVSRDEVDAFSSNDSTYDDGVNNGNNGYWKINGTENSDVVNIISGGNAQDASMITSTERNSWQGGALVYDDGEVCAVNFKYLTDTSLNIYPPLKKDITNGELGNMETGIHLSKRGYIGYTQALYKNLNPKHCEKSKYLTKYRPGDNIPFTIYGGRVGTGLELRNVAHRFQNKYAPSTFYFNMDWGSSIWHNTESGLKWPVQLKGYEGYVEIYIGNSGKNNPDSLDNFDYDQGEEIHIELYVDDILVDSYLKTSQILERVCLDYPTGKNGELKIYSNSWQKTGYGFSIGAITWWINETYKTNVNNHLSFKQITMLMDSWGVFQNNTVNTILKELQQNECGTPIPVLNHSKGSMTSQWGRLWFYKYVQEENTTTVFIDFGINDFNSQFSVFQDEIAPDNSQWPVSFTKDSYIESMTKLINMAINNNVEPIILMPGCRLQSQAIYEWYFGLIDNIAEKV